MLILENTAIELPQQNNWIHAQIWSSFSGRSASLKRARFLAQNQSTLLSNLFSKTLKRVVESTQYMFEKSYNTQHIDPFHSY